MYKTIFKFLICLALAFSPDLIKSQPLPPCVGTTSFTVNPQPTGGGYAPGTVVTYCYTVNNYTQAGANWLEGFNIQLGPGWITGSITPVTPPNNFGGGGGQWLWVANPFIVGGVSFGPGFFFDLNNNGITQDDFGDAGGGPWTICFSVTVGNNVGDALDVGVAPVSDGFAGSWGSNACNGFGVSNLTLSSPTVLGCVQLITPIFNPIASICQNGISPSLPANSTNVPPITGTWSPIVVNTSIVGTNVYTFTPDPNQCATTTTTISIVITTNPNIGLINHN